MINPFRKATKVAVVPPSYEPTITPAEVENGQKKGEEWAPGRQELAAMLTIAVISLMVALDATILVPTLSTLAIDLGGTATDAFWAGTSYLLTSAVFQPFIAALSDIFGRKEMLLVSISLFTLGTLLCAPIAKDFTVLLAGRVVQGLGGGGIIAMGQVIFADIVPLRQRPKYFSIVLASWAVGSVLGPFIGGLFVEHVTWRWCFYINFPFCALGLILVPIFVRLTTERTSLISKLARVDWMGGFLFISGLTIFLVGLSWAGIQYAWSSPQTIVPLVIGAVAVGLSIVWECYMAREPFLRLSLFSSPSAVAAFVGTFCNGFILFCALYYVPLYFMGVRFAGPTQSGLNLIPVTALLLPGSILVSLLTTRLGRFRWAVWAGWAITSLSSGLYLLLEEDTPTAKWAAILAVVGIGNGMVLTAMNVAIQAISSVEDCGRAGAMYAFMRSLGNSVGVAVGGTVFQNVMSQRLVELHLPEEIAHNAEAYIPTLAAMDPTNPIRIGVISAYVQGIHGVFWVLTGISIFAFLVTLIIRSHSMNKELNSRYSLVGGVQERAKASRPNSILPDTISHTNGDRLSRVPTVVDAEKEMTRTYDTIVREGERPESQQWPSAPAVAYQIMSNGEYVLTTISQSTAEVYWEDPNQLPKPAPAVAR